MLERTPPSKGAIWDDYNEQHKKAPYLGNQNFCDSKKVLLVEETL